MTARKTPYRQISHLETGRIPERRRAAHLRTLQALAVIDVHRSRIHGEITQAELVVGLADGAGCDMAAERLVLEDLHSVARDLDLKIDALRREAGLSVERRASS